MKETDSKENFTARSLFSEIPAHLPEEIFADYLKTDHFRIERIVSCGQSTPSGEWLCQQENEWVLVLKGAARLLFRGQDQAVELKAGDYLLIPSGINHLVEWTSPEEETVWLAIHYS